MMKQLFDKIPFRESVDPEDAYELINIVSEYFRMKLAAELTDENQLLLCMKFNNTSPSLDTIYK